MYSGLAKVAFEYTDAHLSIIDTDSIFDDLEARCLKLCEVFDFEYQLERKNIDHAPHWIFYISFNSTPFVFQHYMNVFSAFAQEFQINIANVSFE